MTPTRAIPVLAAALSLGCISDELHANPYGRERSMKFGNPLLTTELSGSLGGVTASKARGGRGYFRVRRKPSNPRSTYQATMRAILASAAASWAGTLDDTQRAAWAAAAPSGLSGIDAFVQAAFNNLLINEPVVLTPPSPLSYAVTPVATDPVVDASAHTIAAVSAEADTGNWLFYASSPQPASQLSRSSSYRFVAEGEDQTTPGSSTAAIPTSHPAYAATAGKVVYVKIVRFDAATGQVATPQEFRVTVQA